MASPVPLAVSLGDPAGVGPELIAAAWARREEENLPPFFVVEGLSLLRAAGEVSRPRPSDRSNFRSG